MPYPNFEKLTQAAFDQYWFDLDSEDPIKAWHARWAFASAAPDVLSMMREAIDGPKIPNIAKKIAPPLEGRDADDFKMLEAASEALRNLGAPALPALVTALQDNQAPEVRARIKSILKYLKSQKLRVHPSRLRRVLEIIGTDDAMELA